MIGIYIIINNFNGKQYIGKSNNIFRRFSEHKAKRKKGTSVLYRAFRKYGIKNFDFVILDLVKNEDILFDREVYWIKTIKPEYNMNEGGIGNSKKMTNETKQKIRLSLKEIWRLKPYSEKQEFIKNNLMGRKKGYKHNKVTKEKLRIANIGKKQTEETKLKRSLAMQKSMKNNTNRNKAVCQMDSKGNVLNEFASLKIAGETLNISPSGITKAIKGEQKTAGKYYWKLK